MVMSKDKGNTFERKISNVLSARFKDVTGIEKAFKRNADSGSFFGGKNQTRVDVYDLNKANFGDIISPDNFNFSVECKHYKAPPTFTSIIKQNIAEFDQWIKQAEQDALNSKKEIAIIIKYNNVNEIVIVKKLFGTLKSIINYNEYFIVTLEDFLAQNDNFFFT